MEVGIAPFACPVGCPVRDPIPPPPLPLSVLPPGGVGVELALALNPAYVVAMSPEAVENSDHPFVDEEEDREAVNSNCRSSMFGFWPGMVEMEYVLVVDVDVDVEDVVEEVVVRLDDVVEDVVREVEVVVREEEVEVEVVESKSMVALQAVVLGTVRQSHASVEKWDERRIFGD